MANRLIAGGQTAVSMEASCHGDWILSTALQRVEAGALHTLAGRPEQLHISAYPWLIQVVEGEETPVEAVTQAQEEAPMPGNAIPLLQKGLAFR